jgi:hypothetical protein
MHLQLATYLPISHNAPTSSTFKQPNNLERSTAIRATQVSYDKLLDMCIRIAIICRRCGGIHDNEEVICYDDCGTIQRIDRDYDSLCGNCIYLLPLR